MICVFVVTRGAEPQWKRRPAATSSVLDLTYLGLDVHRDSISAGVLLVGSEIPTVDRIANDEPSVRRLIGKFPDRSRLRVCYEAGPTGFALYRLLSGLGVACQVVAPSLIPKAPGDRIKTDRRDCRRLARLHRAGELTAIRVPTPDEEAVRDLCRTREDMVADLTRARHRLNKFLLRHDEIYRAGSAWTVKHEQWLASRTFAEPALQATFAHYRAVLAARQAELRALESDLAATTAPARSSTPSPGCRPTAASPNSARSPWPARSVTGAGSAAHRHSWPSPVCCPASTPPVRPSAADTSPRPATPTCAPSWSSRPGPTSTGPASAPGCAKPRPPYQPARPPGPGPRNSGLCARFRSMSTRKNVRAVVVTAIARELAGFIWAEMTSDPPPDPNEPRPTDQPVMFTSRSPSTSAAGLPGSRTRRGTAVAVVIPVIALCRDLLDAVQAADPLAAHLVRGTSLRIPDLRFQPANIRVAARRPTLPRRFPPHPARPP